MVVYNHWDTHQCYICANLYDPLFGDPEQNIPVGVPFTELPRFWRCLGCDASKKMYLPLSNGITC